jgi:hypothetical protein
MSILLYLYVSSCIVKNKFPNIFFKMQLQMIMKIKNKIYLLHILVLIRFKLINYEKKLIHNYQNHYKCCGKNC